METLVQVPIRDFTLEGMLNVPEKAIGLVLFVHGSGSSRLSPRNQFVAKHLNHAHIATLLIDLLSEEEDRVYQTRFDIDLLTERVTQIIAWLKKQHPEFSLGLFGASTGAAAALRAAAKSPKEIRAVVSRGGRPDLAMVELKDVKTPTLFIVGGEDGIVVDLNKEAYEQLSSTKKLEIVPHATHLFEEPGCLEAVAKHAEKWFAKYLKNVS